MAQLDLFDAFMANMDRLTAPTHNIPGVSSAVFGIQNGILQGGKGMGADLALQLNQAVVDFARAYRRHDATNLPRLAGELEGHLLGLQTIGAIAQPQADELIGQLHDLAAPDGQRAES